MSFLLPPTIALKSTKFNKYMNYSSDSDSEQHGFLKVNGANVFSSLAKFEVFAANTGTGLVHIRCRHNKKFLRRRKEDDVYLSPEADEPEEDKSKWSCTLFEPQAAEDGNPDKVRLKHVHANQYARAWDDSGEKFWRLHDDPSDEHIFDVIDLELLLILPKHVAFKSNNYRYLQVADENQLRFICSDKGTSESWFEVFTDGDGRATIKVFNDCSNNYLRFGGKDYGSLIFADGDKGSSWKRPSQFWPIKIDANTVALKCLDNNKFCSRHTGDTHDGLNANHNTCSISNFSRLMLEELVLSRKIYNTKFDLDNAITYGETPVNMATANASNSTAADNTVEFKLTYSDSTSTTWSDSHCWMVGMSVSASFDIPIIGGGGEVTISGEYSKSYEWGSTITSENTLETTYTVTVPAHTSISVSLMATRGMCDVPYSYYQRDVLYNGKTAIYKKDDGLFTGVNSYNFHYVVTTVKDPDSKSPASSPAPQQQTIPLPEARVPIPGQGRAAMKH